MFRAILLLGFGLFTATVALFTWALCEAAARSDAAMDPQDCFTRYRRHVLDCDECRRAEPGASSKRCPIGRALRVAAIEDFVDKQLNARKAKAGL